MGFLDSASSLCDMMNTTMAAVLNEIMSIQADEACGAEYGAHTEARVNSRNGLCTHASLDCIQSSKSRQFALSISHTSLGARPRP